MAFDLNQLPNWLVLVVALAPALAVSAYLARNKSSMWLGFILGVAGWVAALLLRIIPLQLPLFLYGQNLASISAYLLYASVLAGLFEESIRYICMKKASFTRADLQHVASFGLGWGFGEAAIIYGLNIVVVMLVLKPELTFLDALPGAVERNSAVMVHFALAFVVLHALRLKRFLFMAIGIHAFVNAFAIFTLGLMNDVWLVEGIILATALVLVLGVSWWVQHRPVILQELG